MTGRTSLDLRTLISHKVVQQHIWGEVESLLKILFQISNWVCRWKNCENRSIFSKDIYGQECSVSLFWLTVYIIAITVLLILQLISLSFHTLFVLKFLGFLRPSVTSMRKNRNSIWVKTRSSAIAVIVDRTACSILTLYSLWSQHLDLWIKKIRLLSVRGSNNYCGSASASRRVRSPHTSAVHCIEWPLTCSVRHASVSLLTNEPCVFESYAWVH